MKNSLDFAEITLHRMLLTIPLNILQIKLNKKRHVIGIFLDLSKAFDTCIQDTLSSRARLAFRPSASREQRYLAYKFDTICHEKLLIKLDSYGIRGNCLKLIKNYLLNRKQITKFNNVKSDSKNIMFGVPQGSVLGPLIFLLYINDIVNSAFEGETVIFADDTNIFVTGNNEEETYYLANKVLKCVSIYMKVNQLHINLSKCAHMYFRPNLNNNERNACARSNVYNASCILSLNGKKVKKVDKIKFLGVIIDDQLSWNDQIEHVENKLLSTIALIKRIKKCIPPSQYMKIYHSLFESHLTYGISCWGGSYKSKLQKIFCLQKRCIRILFGRTYSLSFTILVHVQKHILNTWPRKTLILNTLCKK